MKSGVYVSKHLSFGCIRKAVWGNAMVANPAWAGEIRPCGMKRGAYGNVSYGGTRNPPHIPKGCGSETLYLWLRAPYFYPKPVISR